MGVRAGIGTWVGKMGVGVAVALAAVALPAARAQAQGLHVLRPINNAIVRETVPIRIAPGDLPADGYVGITIDGKFRTARVLPESKRAPVYDWDTKASYVTPDDPNAQKFVADGPHTLDVKLYDSSGKSLGEKSINVTVANKISVPAQGIKLSYRWRADQQQRYTRRTEADTVADGLSGANQTLQSSIIRFTRTVEDATGGDYLLRDKVLPGGVLVSRGQPQAIDALYNIKSKYRTVDTRGDILGSMAPLSAGDHFGFAIPVLSARRVAVGDTWQAPVQVSLDWATTKPVTFNAESRLEGFEWQSGYPTAKIRETYSGPLTFTPSGAATAAPVSTAPFGGQGASTASSDITLPTVNYERIVYFAYNSGRMVRSETTLTFTADNTQLGSLGFSGGAGAAAPSFPGGPQSPDNSDTSLPPGSFAPPGGGPSPMPYSRASGYPQSGDGYPGPPPGGGYQNAAVPQSTTTNIKLTDITSQDY